MMNDGQTAPSGARGPVEVRPQPAIAALLMIAMSAFVAGSTLFAKAVRTDALGPPLHALQVMHGRFLFAFAIFCALALVLRPRFGKVHLGLHLARTACGGGGIALLFAAVATLPLATVTAISFLNPVFAMLFAILFLGERVGPWRWSAAAIALAGGLVLLRPAGGAEPAALLALAAAVVLGLEIVFIKRLSRRERPFPLLIVNNAVGATLSTIIVVFVWREPTPAQWASLFGVGALMAVAQTAFVNAMRRADASFVAPFSYATLVFAALYDALVFATVPDATAFLGAAIIMAGGVVLLWREGRRGRGEAPAPIGIAPRAGDPDPP